MKHIQQRIGKAKAIELYNSSWWLGRDQRELAKFQLFTAELAMPFDIFHKALEESLGRPVWTHELGLNLDGIIDEFIGECNAPTMQEIMELLPAEKTIILAIK